MSKLVSRWPAPAGAALFVLLALAGDLWRGDPPPAARPPPSPASRAVLAPRPDGPVRDPFRAQSDEIVLVDPPTAAPRQSPRRIAAPPPPAILGTLVRTGRRFVETPDGMVAEGGQLGVWRVVRVDYDAVELEAGEHRLVVPTGEAAAVR